MVWFRIFRRSPAPRIEPLPVAQEAGRPALKKGTLASIIGVTAAGIVLTMTPKEESGRTVRVEFNEVGEARLKHISGRQYLKVYKDIVGIDTYCDGLTKPLPRGTVLTEEKCAFLLEAELVDSATHVMACSSGLRADLKGYQRAGSVIMAHNIGWPRWCKSTARKRLDAGDVFGAGQAMLWFNKARTGKCGKPLCPVRGLTMRRNREREVFMTGTLGFPAISMWQRVERWK